MHVLHSLFFMWLRRQIRFIFYIYLLALGNSVAYCYESFKMIGYDTTSSALDMQIITSTVNGEVLVENKNGMVINASYYFYDLFKLRIHVSCKDLTDGVTVMWMPKGGVISRSSIPPTQCSPKKEKVKVLNVQGKCFVYLNGNTLWRAAVEISKINNYTVYQNLYAIFISNRGRFKGDDISELRGKILLCPSSKSISSIDPKHAKQLFQESLRFKLEMKKRG